MLLESVDHDDDLQQFTGEGDGNWFTNTEPLWYRPNSSGNK